MAVGHLRLAGAAHDLPGGITDVVHAARGPGLSVAELPARGVHREVAAERQVVVRDELQALALLAEARILQAE